MRDVEERQRGYKYYRVVPSRARGGGGTVGMIGRSLLSERSDSWSRIVPIKDRPKLEYRREAIKANSKLTVVGTSRHRDQ